MREPFDLDLAGRVACREDLQRRETEATLERTPDEVEMLDPGVGDRNQTLPEASARDLDAGDVTERFRGRIASTRYQVCL